MCVCSHTHTHTHTYSTGPHTHSHTHGSAGCQLCFSYPSAATDNYTFNSFGENQRKLESPFFLFYFFSTQTQHEKCFIKVQNTLNLLQYLTLHEFVNNCPLVPKTKKKKKKRKSQPSGLMQSLWATSSKLMTQSLQITHLYYYKITGNKIDKTLR